MGSAVCGWAIHAIPNIRKNGEKRSNDFHITNPWTVYCQPRRRWACIGAIVTFVRSMRSMHLQSLRENSLSGLLGFSNYMRLSLPKGRIPCRIPCCVAGNRVREIAKMCELSELSRLLGDFSGSAVSGETIERVGRIRIGPRRRRPPFGYLLQAQATLLI